MKIRIVISVLVLLFLALACNAPAVAPQAAPSVTDTPVPTSTAIPPTPTATLAPPDLPFTIDCSVLDPSRQPDCDAFIQTTRDQVYGIMREITGVSLSACYSEVHYTILPGDPTSEAGGLSGGSQITYSQTYSINLPHKYDVHELLHSFSACSVALDDHLFHGLILDAVYARMGVFDSGYFTQASDPVEQNQMLMEQINQASGDELRSACHAALSIHLTNAYFVLGEGAIQALYRSTINPQPVNSPNEKLTSIWTTAAQQIQALLETLRNNFKDPLNIPACGYQ